MKLAFIVPDGVGVRNFILGPFLRLAASRWDVHVFHAIPAEFLSIYQNLCSNDVEWEPLLPARDTPMSYILRNALSYGQMFWADTQAMRNQLRRDAQIKGGTLRLRCAKRAARSLGRLAASPRGLRRLDQWHGAVLSRSAEVEHYRNLFRAAGISLLFCSHQRPPSIVAPVIAARSLGIPTVTFIFSWDNLTSKGRIAAPFDHYLVWSQLMGDELVRYYPEVFPEQIHVVGTPQFDPYADKSLRWSREKFFGWIGADASRPLLVFSGSDVRTCPDDPRHVRILMDLVRSGAIAGKPQVLLRPHPADIAAAPRRDRRVRLDPRVFANESANCANRFDEVLRDYPELIYAQPAWIHAKPGDWASAVPLPEDDQFMANLAQHANLCVNVASTVTLDFAIHDKPVVNIAFDASDPPPLGKPLWDHYYQFEHYRPVVEAKATRIARSPEELAEHINCYLRNPALDRENRRRIVELEVGVPIGSSAERTIEVLERIGRRNVGGRARSAAGESHCERES